MNTELSNRLQFLKTQKQCFMKLIRTNHTGFTTLALCTFESEIQWPVGWKKKRLQHHASKIDLVGDHVMNEFTFIYTQVFFHMGVNTRSMMSNLDSTVRQQHPFLTSVHAPRKKQKTCAHFGDIVIAWEYQWYMHMLAEFQLLDVLNSTYTAFVLGVYRQWTWTYIYFSKESIVLP